jgi:lysophospholipase L1-like esterase
MQTILCFGDSNTWGYDPKATASAPFPIRYAPDVRWTGVLAKELGADFRVIEEGQNGRTTVHDDPIAHAPRNGRHVLPVILESHKPIDLVVMMLGGMASSTTNTIIINKLHHHNPNLKWTSKFISSTN